MRNRTVRLGVLLILVGLLAGLFAWISRTKTGAEASSPAASQPAAAPINDKRRMDQLRAIDAEFGLPYADQREANNCQTVSGSIRMANGSPLPTDLMVECQVRGTRPEGLHYLGRVTQSSTRPSDGRFEIAAPFGYVWLSVNHPALSPVTVGPLLTLPGGTLKHDLVLDSGFTARVKVIDQEGKPAAGARIGEMEIFASERWIKRPLSGESPISTADGMLLIPHCGGVPTRILLLSDEYTDRDFGFASPPPGKLDTWDANRQIEHRLSRAMPVTGRVLLPDGAPAAGAKLLLATRSESDSIDGSSWTIHLYDPAKPIQPIATADDHGNFRVTSIAKQGKVSLMALTADGSRAIVKEVKAGTTGLMLRLRRPATLRLTLTGNFERLDVVDGKPTAWFNYFDPDTSYAYPTMGGGGPNGYHLGPHPDRPVEIKISDGIGRCEIPNLFTGYVAFNIGGGRLWKDVAGQDIDAKIDMVRDLSWRGSSEDIHLQTVEAALALPPGREPAEGFVRFTLDHDCDGPWRWGRGSERFAAVHDGKARVEMPSPHNSVELHSDALIGYTFEPVTINPKEAQFTQSAIDLRPAGAIYGSSTTLRPTVQIYAVSLTHNKVARSAAAFNQARGTYVIHSVPLNTHVAVIAEQFANGVTSTTTLLDDVVLTDESPARRLDITAEMVQPKPPAEPPR